jgi:hypothetical protein
MNFDLFLADEIKSVLTSNVQPVNSVSVFLPQQSASSHPSLPLPLSSYLLLFVLSGGA